MDTKSANDMAQKFIQFLESGEAPEGLFTNDVFCDFTLPLWRLQAQGLESVVSLRVEGHPGKGKVSHWRCDPTPSGFVLEVEERWHQSGKDWHCRELFRADLNDNAISNLSVYCTGDWDADREDLHHRSVKLIHP